MTRNVVPEEAVRHRLPPLPVVHSRPVYMWLPSLSMTGAVCFNAAGSCCTVGKAWAKVCMQWTLCSLLGNFLHHALAISRAWPRECWQTLVQVQCAKSVHEHPIWCLLLHHRLKTVFPACSQQ